MVAEGCQPGNGAIDPGEDVTVSFGVKNIGPDQPRTGGDAADGGVTFPAVR